MIAPAKTRISIRYAPYIAMDELAQILNLASAGLSSWDAARVRSWLRDADALVPIAAAKSTRPSSPVKTGRRAYFTTLPKLRDAFPDLYHQVIGILTRQMITALERGAGDPLAVLPPAENLGSTLEEEEATLDASEEADT
jgi:hypothetical protein